MNETLKSRRGFLFGALTAPVALAAAACARGADKPKSATVDIENFSAAGKSLGKGIREFKNGLSGNDEKPVERIDTTPDA